MESFQINLEKVTFTYEDGVKALSDLNIQARPGEFLVVLGANGAGKSTLCFLLSGIVPHIYGGKRSGNLSVAGHDPWDEPLFRIAEYCGVLLQDPEVQLFNPNVFTEMSFGPANLKVEKEEIIRRVGAAMSLLHLDGMEKRNPRDLSGGQKQRVALGAVLTMQPKVLVLDEPTSQLDPVGRSEVVESIHLLKSAGEMTIVMTTHETDDILDLADQVLVLDKGKLVLSGTPAQVFSRPDVLRAAGIKIPDALDIWMQTNQLCGQSPVLSSEQVQSMDAAYVGKEIGKHLSSGDIQVSQPMQEPAQTPTAAHLAESGAILQAVNLTYRYPGFPPVTALRDVNISIQPGELVGIVGQNGSGKSTLVKCFVGLLRPQQGEVYYKGADIRKTHVGEMARQVGLVLQNPDYQLFTVSSRDEIHFGLRNLGIEGEQAEAITQQALSWVGLEQEIETFPFRMSFGDRRKLAVAATVALDPQVLILDEPTTAQDHRGRYQLADIGKRFRDEQGRTILMITHDMDLIARYAERLIVMWNGQVILDGPTAEVFAQKDILAQTFLRPPVAAEVSNTLSDYGVPQNLITAEDLMAVLQRRAG